MNKWLVPASVFLCFGAPACTSTPAQNDGSITAAPDMAMAPPDLTTPYDFASDPSLVQGRSYKSHAPSNLDATKPAPFILLLHGLGDTGPNLAAAWQWNAFADAKGFITAYPTGTKAPILGNNFWNATDAFALLGSKVDDVAYLSSVINDMTSKYNIDPQRIYVVGFSNGGMMAHTLACNIAPRVAAVVSVSGVQYNDITKCTPAVPVAVIEIHGDADATLPYQGGKAFSVVDVPSAPTTAMDWVTLNGCDPTPDTSTTPIQIEDAPAMPATVQKWNKCMGGSEVQLWTRPGGGHIPMANQAFFDGIWTFLSSHTR